MSNRRDHLPKTKGSILHSFMMGTDKNLDAPTNVEVITYMEQEVLQVGKTNGFEGIFTTNTNPLTQVRLKGYIFIKLEKYILKLCIYYVYI